ncbi:MAG: hypothetical protein WCJ03_06685 [Bacteroidales bacterium]
MKSTLINNKWSEANIPSIGEMLHRKELTCSPIEHLFDWRKFVDGLLTRQLFDSLVFVFVPTGTCVVAVVI